MTNNSTLFDYKVFIKKNLKIILTTTLLLLTFVFLAFFAYINRPTNVETVDEEIIEEYVTNEILPNIESSADLEALSDEDQTILEEYLNKDSYLFRIYIENEDESPFSDTLLLEEILTNESVVQTLQDQTNTNLSQFVLLNFSIIRIPGSNMLEFQISTNDESTNKNIAEFYYQYVTEENIPLLNDKSIYPVDSEVIPYEELYEDVAASNLNNADEELSFREKIIENIEGLIIITVIGILAGLLGGLIISLIKERINKKLPSIYNFSDFKTIETINLDAIEPDTLEVSDNVIVQSVVAGNNKNKLILSEKKVNERLYKKIIKKTSNSEVKYYFSNESLENVDLENVSEIVILAEIYKTSKKWFEKQMEQVRSLGITTKVIRIPTSFNNFEES